MKNKKIVSFMFIILYAIYTLVAINMKLAVQIIPYGNFYVYFYISALVILLVIFHYKPLIIKARGITFRIIRGFTFYIVIFSIITYIEGPNNHLTSEILAFFKYIMVIALTVYFVKQFDLYSELLFASFIGGSGLLIYEFALAGFPLDIFSRLGTFFSNAYELRYRLNFNFTNPNTVGNIAACMFIVYWLMITWNIKNEGVSIIRKVKLLICTIVVIVDLIVLLSTGSRNSLLIIIISQLALYYFKITKFDKISDQQKAILKIVVFFCGVLTVYFCTFSSAFEMFETSGRLKSFKVNIPILFKNHRFLEGLGLMNPGLFGGNKTGYGSSYILDNYYLYVFLETGLVGLGFIVILINRFAKQIRLCRIRIGGQFTIISAAFVSWLISGIGETCVFYPHFPSSLIYFVIFLALIDNGETIINNSKNKNNV